MRGYFVIYNFLFISTKLTLGKNERLKSRKQLEFLFKKGKSIVVFPFRVYFVYNTEVRENDFYPVLMGAGVGKKYFKKAVDRNKIKRITREAFRLTKPKFTEIAKAKGGNGQLQVFFLYTHRELPEFQSVKDKLELIPSKISEKLDLPATGI